MEFPTRIFEERDSVVTDLLKNKYMQTIYNILIALGLAIVTHSIAQDYIEKNELRLGFQMLCKGFKGFHVLVVFWVVAFVLSLLPYYCVQFWHQIRKQLKSNALFLYTWDRFWLLSYVFYAFALLAFATKVAVHYELGSVVVVFILGEQVRMVMKAHAFVRTFAPRCLESTSEKQNKTVFLPKLSHYLYFLFAPTLLYRDNYPRSQRKIRWGYVLRMFLEVAAGTFIYTFILDMSFLADFREFGLRYFPPHEIITKILKNAFYGIVTIILIGYLVLHAWLNAFAELLLFADKLFYKDWWTSTNFSRYFRTWNVVVHDWLYAYIYQDLYRFVMPKRKILAKIFVIFISSLFHDVIISVALGYFVPVFLVCFFLLGSCLSQIKPPNTLIANLLVVYSIALGTSIILSTHYMEYFARVNCDKEQPTLKSLFTPKIFTCFK